MQKTYVSLLFFITTVAANSGPLPPKIGTYIEKYDCTVVKVTTSEDGQLYSNCAKGKIPVAIEGRGRIEYIDSNDPSRPYSEFIRLLAKNSEHMNRYGYIVDDGSQTKLYDNLMKLDRNVWKSKLNMEEMAGRPLADLSSKRGLTDVGAILLTRSTKGKPAKIKRFLNHETLGDLWLDEVNFVQSGIVIQVPTDSLNMTVNDNPASFVSFQLLNGKTISSLSWREGDFYYTLSTDSDLVSYVENKETFFELAQSITFD